MNLDKEKQEIMNYVKKELGKVKSSDELWEIKQTSSGRIAMQMADPRNPNKLHGYDIDASNLNKIKFLVENCRRYWKNEIAKDNEYNQKLIAKFKESQ